MAIEISTNGKQLLLQQKKAFLNTLVIHLFKNDYVPTAASVTADFQEADFAGYAPVGMSTWGNAFVNGDLRGQIEHDLVTWTAASGATPNTIYGYYVTTSTGQLVFSERNEAGGSPMTATGNIYNVLPRLLEDTLTLP